jgi:hypothetical protein
MTALSSLGSGPARRPATPGSDRFDGAAPRGEVSWSQQAVERTGGHLRSEDVFLFIIMRGRQFPRRLKATVPLSEFYGTENRGDQIQLSGPGPL